MTNINEMTYEELKTYTTQLVDELEVLRQNETANLNEISRLNDKIWFLEAELDYFKNLFIEVVRSKNHDDK